MRRRQPSSASASPSPVVRPGRRRRWLRPLLRVRRRSPFLGREDGGSLAGRILARSRALGGRPDRTTTEELQGAIVARSPSHHGRALQEWRGDAKPFLGTLDREGRAARQVEWRRGGNVRWVLLDVVWIRDTWWVMGVVLDVVLDRPKLLDQCTDYNFYVG